MSGVRDALAAMGLPRGDLHELPDSTKRFPDGAQYRVEIPSTEGPACLAAVLHEAERLDVRVHRVSQGSGVFMLTDAELDEVAALGCTASVSNSSARSPGTITTPSRSPMTQSPGATRTPPMTTVTSPWASSSQRGTQS